MNTMETLTLNGTTFEVADRKARQKLGNVDLGALRGSASGENFVKIEDISPVEHELGVRVESKNLITSTDTYTVERGITFERQADGSYHVYGDNDGSGNSYSSIYITLPEGRYVGSGCPEGGSGATHRLQFYNRDTARGPIDYGSGVTFEVLKEARFAVQLLVYAGQTGVDLIFKPMLVRQGTVTDEYVAPVDVSKVKMVKSGKNLINVDDMLSDALTKDGDTYTLTKISDSDYLSKWYYTLIPANTPLLLSMKLIDNNIVGKWTIILVGHTSEDPAENKSCYISIPKNSAVSSVASFSEDIIRVRIYLEKSEEDGSFVKFKDLQLEVGEAATPYEPYVKPVEYTPSIDGPFVGVTSFYPTTVLMSDTPNVIIEANYNRDINKAFDELKAAILSLGGNV